MVLAEDSICTKKMVKQYKEWDQEEHPYYDHTKENGANECGS